MAAGLSLYQLAAHAGYPLAGTERRRPRDTGSRASQQMVERITGTAPATGGESAFSERQTPTCA